MTDTASALPTVDKTLRIAFILGGLLSIVLGVLILVWPGRTALIATGIVAAYTVAAGLVYAGTGIFSKRKGGWSRFGHIALGALFVVAGVMAFANLGATAVWLAAFLGILVGVLWIVEGAVSLSTLDQASSKGWTIAFAVLSVIAGAVLLFSPLWGAFTLWWLLGISAIALGLANVLRAFSFGR